MPFETPEESMIVSPCRAHGCNALTIGSYCVEHDLPVTRVFLRGRPFVVTSAYRVPERVAVGSPRRRFRRANTISA